MILIKYFRRECSCLPTTIIAGDFQVPPFNELVWHFYLLPFSLCVYTKTLFIEFSDLAFLHLWLSPSYYYCCSFYFHVLSTLLFARWFLLSWTSYYRHWVGVNQTRFNVSGSTITQTQEMLYSNNECVRLWVCILHNFVVVAAAVKADVFMEISLG